MAREMFGNVLQLRPGRRVEPEFSSRSAPRTVNHTTIAYRAGYVEIEAHQNYAIGESRWSDDEYRLPPGAAVLVILVLSLLTWGVFLAPLFAIFRQ
jgi:hypothetical protein